MVRLWTDYLDNPNRRIEPISKEKLRSGIFTTITPGKDDVAIGDYYHSGSGYTNELANELYHQWVIERDEALSLTLRKYYNEAMGISDNTKENEEMVDYKKINDNIFKEYSTAVDKHFMVRPQIVNYKYNEEKGFTEITWSDKTITRVVAGDDTEKSAYVGFVSACAKKLFGNKSTYLNQFDKWTVKIPARQKAEAEKKAAEDKAREEARAKRAAKKAERKAKRDIEIRAKQLADEYYAQEIEDEAEKIAHEKYGVPKNWFDGYSED